MVTKIDKSKSTNVKVKQKQNVNVRGNIDQRNTKKKPKKKRSNIPSAKREGVSSFSSGFTPVYIQSGNPYPISPIPPVPDATPIKTPIYQRDVPSFTNPPVTSTTNINQTPSNSRSISPTTLFSNTPLLSESVGGRIHGKGYMHSDYSAMKSKQIPINKNEIFKVSEKMNEKIETRKMGNEDNNVAYRRLPTNIQNSIREKSNNMDIVAFRELPNNNQNNMDIVEIPSDNIVAQPREKRKYEKKNMDFWFNKKYRKDGGL
jgi:hypothetical protein